MLGQRFVRDPSRKRERDPRIAAPDGIRPLLAALFCADMSSIGVVIVTWDSRATIDRCLESCAGLSVTVADNASTDDTLERVARPPPVFPTVNSENLGFSPPAQPRT